MVAHDPTGGDARGAAPCHSHNLVLLPAHRRGGHAGPKSAPAAVGEVHERVERLEIGDGIQLKAARGVGATTPADGFVAAGLAVAEAVLPRPCKGGDAGPKSASAAVGEVHERVERLEISDGIRLKAARGVDAPAPVDGFEVVGLALAEAVLPSAVQRYAMPAAMAAWNAACAEAGAVKTDTFGIPVEVSGKGGFEGAGMADPALQNRALCVHESPMPVQRSSTPLAKADDIIPCAQVGSGKTAVLCLPVMSGLAAAKKPVRLRLTLCRELWPQIMRGSWPCRVLLILLLMLLFMGTEAHLSEICPVDQSTFPAPFQFQSKRPDSSIKNWITEQNYIVLPSVGKVERKDNIDQCPPESWQRTTVQVVGFVANFVINLGPLISCSRIEEVNTVRRWLLTLSSSTLFAASLFWLIYFWWQNCWDPWRFSSSVFSLICNIGYMIFFLVEASNRNCSYIIFYLFSIIVGVASALVLWEKEFKTRAGVLGVVLTVFGQLFRMMAFGKKWCMKAFVVAVWGIVGSSMIGSIISLVARYIDLVVLLYYGFRHIFSQAEQVFPSPSSASNIVPSHLESAQSPLLPPPTPGPIPPALGTMDMPSLPAMEPDGTIPAPPSVAVPRSSGVVMHPSSPRSSTEDAHSKNLVKQDPVGSSSSNRALVPQDATGCVTSLPNQEVDRPTKIPNSNVPVATDDVQRGQ